MHGYILTYSRLSRQNICQLQVLKMGPENSAFTVPHHHTGSNQNEAEMNNNMAVCAMPNKRQKNKTDPKRMTGH